MADWFAAICVRIPFCSFSNLTSKYSEVKPQSMCIDFNIEMIWSIQSPSNFICIASERVSLYICLCSLWAVLRTLLRFVSIFHFKFNGNSLSLHVPAANMPQSFFRKYRIPNVFSFNTKITSKYS